MPRNPLASEGQRRIEDMLEALPTSADFSHADGEQMVDAIVAFLDDLKTLGETAGVDLGGDSLAQVLSRTLHENLKHLLNQLTAHLDVLEAHDDVDEDELNDQVSQGFSRAQGYLASLFPQLQCDIALLLVDAYARAALDIPQPKIADCPTWSLTEILDKEKEITGMFLSGHPLDHFRFEIQHYESSRR